MSESEMMLAAGQPTALATTSLGADVGELEKALSFFERMGKAALLPEGVKGPADALMLATAGHRLGFDLMTSLRAFHIIKGQVVLRADMMRAVVFSAGKRSGVDIHVVETSKARAVMVGVRNGREVCIEVTFEDAKAAGLTGSDTWKKYPAQMLVAAATRQLGRLLFPDLLAGIYTPDEMGQFEPPPAAAEVAAFARREPAARVVADTAPDVEDAEVEEVRYTARAGAHPRVEYLLGDDLSLETLCWYLAARDKPIESATLEAANAWAASVGDSAWAKHGQAMREAITRRLSLIEGHGGPRGLLEAAALGSPMWTKAHTAAERLGLPKDPTEWPPRALVGIALAVAEEKAEAPQPKKGPGAKALDQALEVPGGWDAIVAGFRRAGVEAPVMGSLTDQQQGELAYSVVMWTQASASAEDTTALVCEALSDAP